MNTTFDLITWLQSLSWLSGEEEYAAKDRFLAYLKRRRFIKENLEQIETDEAFRKTIEDKKQMSQWLSLSFEESK
jgi:hypothetical protein